MYILLISRGIPSEKDPQWGCFEFDQAKALSKGGNKVIVASLDRRFRFKYRKLGVSYCKKDGIDCYESFWIPSVFLRLFGFNFEHYILKKQILQLYNKIKSEYGQPDIIYSHYIAESSVACILREHINVPLVVIEHSSALKTKVKDKYIQYLGKRTYSKVNKLISVSNSLRNIILEEFGVDSVVVNNMVGGDFEYRGKSEYGNSGKIRFVSIGSLIRIKGYDILLSALSQVIKDYNNWELLIIGDGDEKDNLQKQADSLSLNNNVHFLGRKNKVEIANILHGSDVFVLASRSETFGVVYIEAMMMGVPVIATVCGGPEEFVQETDGLLVPTEDVDALVDALKYMFENYQSYDGAKIAEDCKKRFSPKVIASKLVSVFENVIEENKII